jgi:hypothetical protein
MFPYKNWISVPERSGETAPGLSGELSVHLNSQALNDGDEYEASLIVHSNSQNPYAEIPVKLTVNNSVETGCYAPENLQAVLTANYYVQLSWSLPTEASQIKAYRVFRDGKPLHEGGIENTSFVDTIPGMGLQRYTVRAIYNSGCESYDSEPAELFVNNPGIILPAGLTASVVNKKQVVLKWDIPHYGTGFFDDFESYPAFAMQDIGKWKLVDGDRSWTYYDHSVSYLNAGNQMAFMVFNPSACTPVSPITPCDDKKQFLACFSANVDKLANNDWLISPELNFNRPFTFSFMAKTHALQYGFEKINIGYSLTGNNPEDFIFINGNTPLNVADIWWKYEYTLPAGAKYVTINCVTMNGFILFVDNVYIGYPEYYSELLGYNIYRNGEKLNTGLLQTYTYSDPALENGTYTYELEALYANSASSKAVSTVEIDYSYEAMPPRELAAVRQGGAIQLSWLHPLNIGQEELRYGSGLPAGSMGGVDEEQFIGVRWNASDLEPYLGYSITGLQFHIAEPVMYVAPFLYENGTFIAGTEEIEVEYGKYTTFRFNTPLTIKPDAEYIVGYSYWTDGEGYYPVSHDAGPAVAGKGDLISVDGVYWYSAYQLWGEEFNVNWTLAMLVEWNEGDEFRGYNLYRNNQKINTDLWQGLSYLDEDNGLRKEYYVTAVYQTYDEKESNHVIVDVSGIKDVNHSLVTVYPNPAKDRLFVKGDYDLLELFSLDGKELRKISFRGEVVSEIDIQHLSPGVYLLGVKKGGAKEYYKVIVNK